MHYVSLGHACQVAHQLKRLGLARETMFYDWLVTQHEKLLKTLDFRFINNLFQDGYTLPENGNYLIECSTGLSFYPHDFRGLAEKNRELIDSQIESVRSKYVRRAERTYDVLNSGVEVCVVRHFFAEPLAAVQSQRDEIIHRLGELYPSTQFTYLWGSEFDAAGVDFASGKIHHLPKTPVWQGDDTAWNRMVDGIV
ncbi:DUF1796 family putative cysteine peptidase [Brucella cytisi]|uniref:Papain-like cysteine peptidase n=1 Tax=Brucella cytisi TaxID=407152 RepID=A0A1J6HDF3_9HYPH|nr:DUF1796 family putative cysteine peptidase [Brucella cytisi]OIS91117.1 hypothetical protein BLA27_23275 [Brucella cytisi]